MWWQRVIERFRCLRRFRESQTKPLQWECCCPCRDHCDRNPSMGVAVDAAGTRVLVSCRRGCAAADILREVGLTMNELFAPEDNREGPYEGKGAKVKVRTPLRIPDAVFIYHDEAGAPLYRAERYNYPGGDKRFALSRHDPSHRDVWVPGLGDCRRVLYRLPDLAAAPPSMPVLYPEGERKADLLAGWGFIATAHAGGADGWRDEFAAFLVGRRVVVLPDNDAAGRKMADRIVGSLVRHGAASVRVVLLPGLAEKGDVADWIANGGTKEKFVDLVRSTPEWRPEVAFASQR